MWPQVTDLFVFVYLCNYVEQWLRTQLLQSLRNPDDAEVRLVIFEIRIKLIT